MPVDRVRGDTGDPVGRVSCSIGRLRLFCDAQSQDRLVVDRGTHLTGAVMPDAVVAVDELATSLPPGPHPRCVAVLRLHPALPEWMSEVTVRQLRVGDASVDFRVARQPGGHHGVEVLAGGDGLQMEIAN